MGHSILIVEDEAITVMLYREILKSGGYRIAGTASTGREAIALASSARPDIIIMDIFLNGDITGVDAARQIRRGSDIPIIFVSANTDEMTKSMALTVPNTGYLKKPVNFIDLLNTVGKHLDYFGEVGVSQMAR